MYQYANSFTYAVNEPKNEIMLSFRQNHPSLDKSGAVVGLDFDTVADIVLSADGLEVLRSLLNDIVLD